MLKDILSKQKVSKNRWKFLLIENDVSATTEEEGMDV